MAKLQFDGIDAYAEQLRKLQNGATGMIKRAVFDGAAVVMQEMKNAISALPEASANAPPGQQRHGVFSYEKDGLLSGIGLSKMQNEGGYINTKIGFDGYNRLKSKKYPKGHPNALIARAINSGTTVRTKIPFVNQAVNAAKAKCEAAMTARFDEDLKNVMK